MLAQEIQLTIFNFCLALKQKELSAQTVLKLSLTRLILYEHVKKFRSFLSFLEKMEWAKIPSHATVHIVVADPDSSLAGLMFYTVHSVKITFPACCCNVV